MLTSQKMLSFNKKIVPAYKPGYIYCVRIGSYVKMGKSHTLKRLEYYKSFPPFEYELVATRYVFDISFFERYIQQQFKKYQHQGEWFDLQMSSSELCELIDIYIERAERIIHDTYLDEYNNIVQQIDSCRKLQEDIKNIYGNLEKESRKSKLGRRATRSG